MSIWWGVRAERDEFTDVIDEASGELTAILAP